MKCILSLLLAFTMLLTVTPTSMEAETLTASKTSSIDLTMDFEKQVFDDVIKSTAKGIVYIVTDNALVEIRASIEEFDLNSIKEEKYTRTEKEAYDLMINLKEK